MTERLFPRVVLSAAARVRTASREIKCRLVELSAGGMALETGTDDEFGRFIRVTVELDSGSEQLDLDAIVHGQETSNGKKRWRVEFHDPSPRVVSRVADYVRERIEQDSPSDSLETDRAADRSDKPRAAPPVDPEVQRLFDLAVENIA